MTINEAEQMLFRGVGNTPEFTPVPYSPPSIAPQQESKMALVELPSPVDPKSFNGLSVNDVAAFHQFKDMDTLHRADAVSAQYERGAKLNEYFGDKVKKANLNPQQTAELIRSHYFKK